MDAVALTEALVRFDTVSDRPNEALCDALAALVAPLGGRIRHVRKAGGGHTNLLVRFGPEGPGGLALAGHTDTVPWDRSMRATTAPERDGRRLYGRGTCDMKGAIACMVIACQELGRDRLASLGRPLWLAFTFEEEVGCHGARLLEAVAPLPVAVCVVGEPTGLRPVTAHKGYCVGRVRLRGVPCHSSDPRQGTSAAVAAAEALLALQRLGDAWQTETAPSFTPPWATLNVGLLQAGTARNVVPEEAWFTVEIRPLPGQSGPALLGQAEAAIRAAVARVPGPRPAEVVVELVEDNAPLGTPGDADLVQWLVRRTGAAPTTVPFYTEAAILTAMGASVAVCGPGAIEQAHRVDEHVDFDALEAAVPLYRDAIEAFCV